MQIQERDAPMRQLRQAFDRAQHGDGQCALVLGEAGIGKTTLLRAFVDDLPAGPRILRGACEDLAIAEPLGPLWDLAREAGWRLDSDLAAPGGRLAVFSEALSSISEHPEPTLILVEDLHWADVATVDFLRFLARRLDGRRLLLILTARSDDQRGRANIRQALAGVSPDRISRIDLKRLSQDAVAKLSQGTGADVAKVFAATNGNPFYVSAVLKSGLSEVPSSVEDAVLARLEDLGPISRELAGAAAVFPRRAEIGFLRKMIGDSDADAAIEDCTRNGLLELQEDYLAFRHEIARQAVERNLSPTVRRRLHLQCLELLTADGSVGTPARRLHHARQIGDTATLGQLAPSAAVEALEVGAVREACEYFALALQYGTPAGQLEKAELLEKAAWANYLMGASTRSLELQASALEIWQELGEVLREGDAYRKLSRYHWFASSVVKARELAETAVRALANHRGPELAMALSTKSQLLMLDKTFSQVAEPAEAAIAMAREFDRPDIVAHALNNLGQSLALTDPDTGRRMLWESIEIALRLDHLDNVARGYTNLAFFEMDLLNLAEAERVIRIGIDYSAEHELDGFAQYLTGGLAWILIRLGRWPEADRLNSAGSFLNLRSDESFQSIYELHTFTGACAIQWLAARRGEPVPAPVTGFISEFISNADELQRLTVHAASLAELAWLGREDRDVALLALRRVVDRAENVALVPDSALWLHRIDPASPLGPLGDLAPCYRLEIEGDWAGAAQAWLALGAPFDAAMALSTGDPAARIQAVALLEGLGATATAERLRTDLRRDGIAMVPTGPRASTRQNPMGLTNRQLDVLRALNDGLSNADIAERLFVSPKTVDHHVSAILAKLDVATRGEAAALARKLDII